MPAGRPVPPDEDLARVLRHIGSGRLANTRARLANSWETREFLEIGLSLLRDDLLEYTGPDLDREDRSRLFESLSRERILKRAEENHSDEPDKMLTVNIYRGRWEHKNKYTEDLIAYLFRLGPQERRLNAMESFAADELKKNPSLAELVRSFTSNLTAEILEDPLSGLQYVLLTTLPRHPRVREFTNARYELLFPRWATICDRIATTYGLRLRPGATWLDVAMLFNMIIEGYVVRARVETARPTLSTGESLETGAIISLLTSLLDIPPGESLDNLYIVDRSP